MNKSKLSFIFDSGKTNGTITESVTMVTLLLLPSFAIIEPPKFIVPTDKVLPQGTDKNPKIHHMICEKIITTITLTNYTYCLQKLLYQNF